MEAKAEVESKKEAEKAEKAAQTIFQMSSIL